MRYLYMYLHTFPLTRLPAYLKFRALVAPPTSTSTPEMPLPPVTPPVELPLPCSYRLLEKKFHCTDTVVSMLQKRKELCTFEKLKVSVQEMSRRWVLISMYAHKYSLKILRGTVGRVLIA